MISVPGRAWSRAASGASRSTTITSAVRIASRPATVSSPGSPGPPPTRIDLAGRSASRAHRCRARSRSATHADLLGQVGDHAGRRGVAARRHDQGPAQQVGLADRVAVQGDQAAGARSATVVPGSSSTTVSTAPGLEQRADHPVRRRPAPADHDRTAADVQVGAEASSAASDRGRPAGGGHERPGGVGVADGDPDPVRAEPGEGVAAADGEAPVAQRQPDPAGRSAGRGRRWCRPGRTGRAGRRPAGARGRPAGDQIARRAVNVSAAAAASARAAGVRQAAIAASAGVDTDHGGCWRRMASISAGSPTA